MSERLLPLLILALLLAGCAQPHLKNVTPTSQCTPAPTLPTASPIQPTTTTSTKFELEYGVKYKVKVIEVVDGDTIDVILPNGTSERVRFLGVDTPETSVEKNKPYEYDGITNLSCLSEWGIKAKQYTSKLEGKYVYIEFDPLAGFRGYYGRLLAYIYYPDENTDFTAELVKKGYARVYTEGSFVKESEYLSYQNDAMENKIGLWGACLMVTPTLHLDVRISYVNYNAPGNDFQNPNGEYVIIKNFGQVPVNLEGWMLKDKAGHTFAFPAITLDPSKSVYVYSGSGINTKTKLYWGNGAIWNNDGDIAYLYDSNGNLIDSYNW